MAIAQTNTGKPTEIIHTFSNKHDKLKRIYSQDYGQNILIGFYGNFGNVNIESPHSYLIATIDTKTTTTVDAAGFVTDDIGTRYGASIQVKQNSGDIYIVMPNSSRGFYEFGGQIIIPAYFLGR